MTFDLTIDNLDAQLEQAFKDLPNRPTARRQMLGAMAARFKLSCLENLGAIGKDRPSDWRMLSPKYAKRVNRPYATLDLTGNLMRSIRVGVNDEFSEVYVNDDECPYAARHQWGDDTMPKRSFFPMTENKLTPLAESQVIDAAQSMLDYSLKGGTYVGPIY